LRLTSSSFYSLMLRPPPSSTLFPYTTLFRSDVRLEQQSVVNRLGDRHGQSGGVGAGRRGFKLQFHLGQRALLVHLDAELRHLIEDRKSTRLNSSHRTISYAVFCLKKKKKSLK